MYNRANQIVKEVEKAVIGKSEVVKSVLLAILAKGHILIEDIPGVGKTTLALAFSKVLSLDYHRLQLTPDVLPTDITGFSLYNKDTGEFEFREGAAFCNLFLADEINRTSSKTQSALLEVMEEGKLTVDGETREVPYPNIVIATQNPMGSIGTFMLPESQLDRFTIKISMGYPDVHSEIEILKGKNSDETLDLLGPVAGAADLVKMQQLVEQTYIDDRIYEYISELIQKTRNHEHIQLGVSTRGALALVRMVKARAFLEARDYVIPEDIQACFPLVVGHRLVLSAKAKINEITEDMVAKQILKQVIAPAIKP